MPPALPARRGIWGRKRRVMEWIRPTRLKDMPGIGVDRMGDAADALADLRFVFANETAERLAGMGDRVRAALA